MPDKAHSCSTLLIKDNIIICGHGIGDTYVYSTTHNNYQKFATNYDPYSYKIIIEGMYCYYCISKGCIFQINLLHNEQIIEPYKILIAQTNIPDIFICTDIVKRGKIIYFMLLNGCLYSFDMRTGKIIKPSVEVIV